MFCARLGMGFTVVAVVSAAVLAVYFAASYWGP